MYGCKPAEACTVKMDLSRRIVALLVVLSACTEEVCKGNETKGGEVLKEVVREPVGSPSVWSRYERLYVVNTFINYCQLH